MLGELGVDDRVIFLIGYTFLDFFLVYCFGKVMTVGLVTYSGISGEREVMPWEGVCCLLILLVSLRDNYNVQVNQLEEKNSLAVLRMDGVCKKGLYFDNCPFLGIGNELLIANDTFLSNIAISLVAV